MKKMRDIEGWRKCAGSKGTTTPGSGWKGTASAGALPAPRWKGAASAVPQDVPLREGFSPGPPRLKANFIIAGLHRARARCFPPGETKASPTDGRNWGTGLVGVIAATLLATGCSRAPSFNLLGSFFPAWLLCGVLGITLAGVTRLIFVRTNFEKELAPLILVYPCLALFYTFTLWLLFFS